ncbi:MAG: prolipoprotein diacylglyceryl transferase [Chloroflexota bacterium]|nr:prolipoprotein diacylglyceryl transferase [Chloroflexota bacterium]
MPSATGRSIASHEDDGSTTVEREALVVSHWFDAGGHGEPYSATIRLTGRRVGVHGQLQPGDTFVQEDPVEGIVPGTGRNSIVSWVYGLHPGEWAVTAELIRHQSVRPTEGWRRARAEHLPRARWSWRTWRVVTADESPVATRWAMLAPLAPTPAVVPGVFTLLAAIAIIMAVVTQAILLARANISLGTALSVTLPATFLGIIAAKLWHAFLHPGPWRSALGGWSVDGFLVVAPIVGVGALFMFQLPVGVFLDATAPGIFFAVAIGRIGCFFTGCCAGRCTTSRWGVWSSDRRIGARRVPSQLLESAAGLIIGVVASALVLANVPGVSGLVFAATIAVYVVIRQFLLRVRAERREFSWRRSALVSRGKP